MLHVAKTCSANRVYDPNTESSRLCDKQNWPVLSDLKFQQVLPEIQLKWMNLKKSKYALNTDRKLEKQMFLQCMITSQDANKVL